MKKFNKRAMPITFVSAILASFAAMPVSAAGINAYSVSYETLTTAITADDGSTIPVGAIAVTLSIDNNTGFNANMLTLNIDEGYSVLGDTNGKPILDKGVVLENAITSAAVSSDEAKLCVATASSAVTSVDGEIFTVYFTTDVMETDDFLSIEGVEAETAIGEMSCVWSKTAAFDYYIIGDTNSDEAVNAIDAAKIMVACSEYNTDFNVVAMGWSVLFYFPEAKHYDAPDANCDKYIDNVDANDILDYAATVGSGGSYEGKIGRRIIFIPPSTSNIN